MEKNKGWIKTECSRFSWAVMAVALCAVPSVWADINITEDEPGDLIVESGTTVNLYADVLGPFGITVEPDSYLNIYSGNVTGSLGILVLSPTNENQEKPVVTVYGTGFEDSYGSISATQWTPAGGSDTLTGTYGEEDGGGSINLLFFSDIPINLQPPAPEDPAVLILQLIITVADLNLHHGIDNSLDSKLDAALNALDDLKANNDVAAINTLQAFINSVEAQSGNKIPVEDANNLIAETQYIIDLLNA
ncbi:MAG: hypothetical protein FVQ85_02695 [Planctomycetes bacterium]|nr:hypothetical protein [Planctomycetota bacterium]